MDYFEDFIQAISDEFEDKLRSGELTGNSDTLSFYIFFSGAKGLVILKGDELTDEKVKTHRDFLMGLRKENKIPPAVEDLYLFYVSEKSFPHNFKAFINQDNINYAGYLDLIKKELYLGPNGKPVTDLIKFILNKWMIARDKDDIHVFSAEKDTSRPWLTWILIAISLLVFIWITMAGGSEKSMLLLRFGANNGALIKAGQWWRTVGSMFLHIGFAHLLLNMFSLLNIGPYVEKQTGKIKFLAVYFVSGICASLISVYQNDIVSAGASGAIFGLCGSIVYLGYRHYREDIMGYIKTQIKGGIIFWIIVNLIYGFTNKNINNGAHIVGLLSGFIFTVIIANPLVDKGKKTLPSLIMAILLIPFAILPFFVEAYALWRAGTNYSISSYPQEEHREEDGNYTFKYPVFMKFKNSREGDMFIGPGFGIQTWNFNVKIPINLEKEAPEFVNELEKQMKINITGHEIIKCEGRKWIIIDGTLEDGMFTRIAFTSEDTKIFRFQIYTVKEQADEGKDILMIIIESFRPGNIIKMGKSER